MGWSKATGVREAGAATSGGSNLASDLDLKHLLPVAVDGKSLYSKIGLFSHITLQEVPGLVTLLRPDETLEDVKKLTPEQILLRWVNHHLSNAGVERRVNNFTSDIQDSEVYTHLLRQIAPLEARINTSAFKLVNHSMPGTVDERAINKRSLNVYRRRENLTLALNSAQAIGCNTVNIGPEDLEAGTAHLVLGLVWQVIRVRPACGMVEAYRNWMNSMGVKPHVNWLYSDLADGVVIFQLFDVIDDDVVDWSRVHVKFSAMRGFMQRLENCNYVVDLGKKKLGFSLVGIGGNNIMEGNETLTLGFNSKWPNDAKGNFTLV
ncbi:PREDICTED: fimbrin-like [Priapulus caudatus]|uniref:Fimbrin-like n=1 Tax=Priapulus caudatus TaxID=37621 RepID=A0ABM1EIL0_PRICU|nr:PREDICTED: fimbrin-like [Priapulus caudatus]